MKIRDICELNCFVKSELLRVCKDLGGSQESLEGSISMSPVPDTSRGDIAMPCFMLRGKLTELDGKARNNPVAIAQVIAKKLEDSSLFEWVEAAGPYVNFEYNMPMLAQTVVGEILEKGEHFGDGKREGGKYVIEFSGPNTNKPQHLGHIRNNVLGESVARIMSKAGFDVKRVNIINDRGIHICKSMLTYSLFGDGITPEKAGKKGDHLIGDFYVLFDKKFQEEYKAWRESPDCLVKFENWKQSPNGLKAQKTIDAYAKLPEEKRKGNPPPELFKTFVSDFKDYYFNNISDLGFEAQQLLIKWEEGNEEVRALCALLNKWVIDGFLETYDKLGIKFDKIYYESDTYKLGRDIVLKGLEDGHFYQLPAGAVMYDLAKLGLQGEKVLLRTNGTSVYMTQDIGTALARYEEFHYDKMTYVVADEQNHHFKVLFGILEELHPELKNHFLHLSYGMVTLPNGRMKSREGTVVDADDLIEEVAALVENVMNDKTNKEHYAEADKTEIRRRSLVIALAAIKYYLLDVTPASSLEFNPEKSIDLQGRTGAYCLMNYARTRSILRKANYVQQQTGDYLAKLSTPQERKLLLTLMQYPNVLQWVIDNTDPSKIAEYLFNLCKAFAFLFTDRIGHPILSCPDPELKQARLALVDAIGQVLRSGLNLLGIETLEEM